MRKLSDRVYNWKTVGIFKTLQNKDMTSLLQHLLQARPVLQVRTLGNILDRLKPNSFLIGFIHERCRILSKCGVHATPSRDSTNHCPMYVSRIN